MKKYIALFIALMAPLASYADAPKTGIAYDALSENGKNVAVLDRCGGTATLSRVDGALYLRIRNATCSNIVTFRGSWKLKGEGAKDRWIDTRIDESVTGWHDIIVGSNAFVTSGGLEGNGDILSIYVPKTIALPTLKLLPGQTVSNTVKLEDCLGSVQAKIVNGSVLLAFSGAEKCSKYDVISNNGRDIYSSAVEMYGDKGIVRFPANEIVYGKNSVEVRFFKPGAREDRVKVVFYAN